MDLSWLLGQVPGPIFYLLLGLLVGVESIGIPVPGETAIIASTLAAHHPAASFGPVGIALAAITGAVVGDSIGYWIGREKGDSLLRFMNRHFPRHVTPAHIGWARDLMRRYGAGAVFGGRFVALLRMLAGPLAGMMGMHYPTFLAANIAGGICWAGGTVALVWVLGAVAETWLKRAGWILLGLVALVAVLGARTMNRRIQADVERWAAEHPDRLTI
ncbi:DedA family protein [Luteococcus peritonei]|uniref:DedA family protein n=1 Tax=Luteococcus peritonei TaxID=88874 RepID=A0ABW4RUC4_9ACTN